MDLSTIPYGRVHKRFAAPFEFAKPSWLETVGGTGVAVPNSAGYWDLSGAGTVTLRTAFDLELGAYEQVALYADGVHNPTSGQSLGLSFKGGSPAVRGVSIWSAVGAATSTYRAFGSGTPDQQIPYYWGGVEATRRRNLGLIVRPARREVLLVMDDQVIWSRTELGMVLGDVRAVVDSGGLSGGGLRLAQFRLELQHN